VSAGIGNLAAPARRALVLACLWIGLATGCATPARLGLPEETGTKAEPVADAATLVFFWQPGYWAVARGIYVQVDGERVGGLNRGTYFVHRVRPGRIALSAEDWLRDEPTLDIDAAAGRVYYIRASIDWGVLDVVPRLELIDEARGKAKIAELKQVVPD
jgi:hypothetical protein